jgi:hypothetical protein
MSDKDILDLFIEIGFTLNKEDKGIGVIQELKYYPDYLGDNHYTLITFRHNNYINKTTGTEFRLYVHKNIDGSFVSTPFQSSSLSFILSKVNDIFTPEFREIKLNKVLQ